MSNLRALHQLARRRGLSVVLDAARAFENSALIRERERGYETRSLASLVAELCSYADACCASLTKDFCVARGAFVGVRDPAPATTLTDLAILGCGDGLEASDRSVLGQALQLDHEGPLGRRRPGRPDPLACAGAGAPGRAGRRSPGHGVFVDAAALIGPPADGADAAATLCAALYAAGGVRAAPHLGTPQQQAAGTRWVRLALPVGIELPLASERVSHAFSLLMAEKASIALLKPGPASARGWLGELTRHYIPV